jgi:hypothetical protein
MRNIYLIIMLVICNGIASLGATNPSSTVAQGSLKTAWPSDTATPLGRTHLATECDDDDEFLLLQQVRDELDRRHDTEKALAEARAAKEDAARAESERAEGNFASLSPGDGAFAFHHTSSPTNTNPSPAHGAPGLRQRATHRLPPQPRPIPTHFSTRWPSVHSAQLHPNTSTHLHAEVRRLGSCVTQFLSLALSNSGLTCGISADPSTINQLFCWYVLTRRDRCTCAVLLCMHHIWLIRRSMSTSTSIATTHDLCSVCTARLTFFMQGYRLQRCDWIRLSGPYFRVAYSRRQWHDFRGHLFGHESPVRIGPGRHAVLLGIWRCR